MSGAQIPCSDPAINESKTGGEKFQVVLDAGNAKVFDSDVTEEPSSGSKEGLQHTRDTNEKNLTIVKSSSKQSCIISNEKKSQSQRGDIEKQNEIGAPMKQVSPVSKGKLKEENGEVPMSRTENVVQDSQCERNSVTDNAATGAVLSTDTEKALSGTVIKRRQGTEGGEKLGVDNGINDNTLSAGLHYIGGDEGEEPGMDIEGEGEEGDGGG